MLDELIAQRDALQESLNANPAYCKSWQQPYTRTGKGGNPSLKLRTVRLIDFVPRNGQSKGEIQHLTIAQYKAMTGHEPKACIVKDGYVRWEYALDELAQELGYQNYDTQYQPDEMLRLDIERGYRDRMSLKAVESQIKDFRTESGVTTMPEPQLDKASEFGAALKAILEDGNKASDLCKLVAKYYVIGYANIGQILATVGKGVN